MRILKEQTLGLVIDVQERLLPHISHNEEVLRNIEILLEGLKILDVPIIITEQYTKGLGPTVASVMDRIPDFTSHEKMTFSCCDDGGFNKELDSRGRKNILICGIEAHVCVLQTVVDLLEKGYQPVVIADCISSRKLSDNNIALDRMRQEGAIISSYESVLFELVRVSGTETFKAISKLVK
ncbi:MAG: hydrolase [Bacteroidales bacterium]|jgi:nicotinamidase-related amidase|nr:hydrolase [Bacteroidales bacterium]